MSSVFQRPGHAANIVAPVIGGLHLSIIQGELDGFIEVDGVYYQLPVLARRDGNAAGKINRRRHDKSVVIVGMLTNKIHPARSAVKSGSSLKDAVELQFELSPVGRALV